MDIDPPNGSLRIIVTEKELRCPQKEGQYRSEGRVFS
jgi:hypothetical protein